jgi:hypothetical protein
MAGIGVARWLNRVWWLCLRGWRHLLLLRLVPPLLLRSQLCKHVRRLKWVKILWRQRRLKMMRRQLLVLLLVLRLLLVLPLRHLRLLWLVALRL